MKNSELRRYGHTAGTHNRWCAACNREFQGDPKAFKCRGCAVEQYREVEKILDDVGMGHNRP